MGSPTFRHAVLLLWGPYMMRSDLEMEMKQQYRNVLSIFNQLQKGMRLMFQILLSFVNLTGGSVAGLPNHTCHIPKYMLEVL